MEVIEVKFPTNPSHLYRYGKEKHEAKYIKYTTMTSKYPLSIGGIWTFMDEVRKRCQELNYPGIFLYDIEEKTDVPVNDRLEKSVYIRWDFIKYGKEPIKKEEETCFFCNNKGHSMDNCTTFKAQNAVASKYKND